MKGTEPAVNRIDTRAPLARMMDELGLRVSDVCALSGLGGRVVSNLRAGRYSEATVTHLVLLASAVGCRPTDLVPGLDARPALPGATTSQHSALQRRIMARRAREAATRKRCSALAERAVAEAVARVEAESAEESEFEVLGG
jgi:hypothetical protein